MIEVFLLIFSLSIDSMVAGFSLGMNHIRIPIQSILLLNGVGSLLLFFSILFGFYFQNWIPVDFAHLLSTILFLLLGSGKLLESLFHRLTRTEKEIKIQFSKIEFIFHIYANPEESDLDCSKQISCKEAFCLGLALSLDNLAVGIGIGLLNVSCIGVTICSFLVGTLFITIGHLIGRRICKKWKWESAWISGIILIVLAFLK